MDEFRGFLNLVLLILFVAATVLGPLIDRWRKRKEMERRAQRPPAGTPAAEEQTEADVGEAPRPQGNLPYEEVLHELFGPYMERRKRKAEEAQWEAEPEVVEVVEEEVRERPVAPPEAVAVVPMVLPPPPSARPRYRSLDEIVFRNPRLSPGAKLLLAAEILGKPRSRR